MGKFYTGEQVREAIAALENYSPGIWKRMKELSRVEGRLSDEQESALSDQAYALGKVLSTMPFVTQADDPSEAKTLLILDVNRALGEELAHEDAQSTPVSKND